MPRPPLLPCCSCRAGQEEGIGEQTAVVELDATTVPRAGMFLLVTHETALWLVSKLACIVQCFPDGRERIFNPGQSYLAFASPRQAPLNGRWSSPFLGANASSKPCCMIRWRHSAHPMEMHGASLTTTRPIRSHRSWQSQSGGRRHTAGTLECSYETGEGAQTSRRLNPDHAACPEDAFGSVTQRAVSSSPAN